MTEAVNILPVVFLTIINGYWTWRSRQIQNDREIIKAQELQIEQLKAQYHHQLVLNKHLQGELKTYQQFHEHDNLT